MNFKTDHQDIIKRRLKVVAFAAINLIVGCATPWEKSALLKDQTPNIERIQGPTQRSLMNWKKKRQEIEVAEGRSLKPIAGTEEYLAAVDIYKKGEYEEARKAFKKVAKDFKKSEIREDALFMQAESSWYQEHYAAAHDAYAILLKDFPSTRHMNVVAERMFKIGRFWLEFPEVAGINEIQQVNFENPTEKLPSQEPPKVPKPTPIFKPNFSDKQKPLFDTAGNGVACLTAVWMNDPTGPLADDAMMLVASYYARRGNWVEADRYFQMLRETFPNSPHVENAFVLGSHVKLMSYQGPEYEGRTLLEAQLLKESTVKLYPNNSEVSRIKDELVKIEEAKALELWTAAELYLRKGKPRAAAIYCHRVISEYPKSAAAKKARAKLVELGPEYTNGAKFLDPHDPPNDDILYQVLEVSPSQHLKNWQSGGSTKPNSKSKQPTGANSNPPAKQGTGQNPADRSKSGQYEESPDEIESPPTVDPEKQPKKKRSWLPFNPPPKTLPDGAADNAKNLDSKKSGQSRLQ